MIPKLLAYAVALACVLIFSRCKITRYTPDKFPSQQLIWGSGGGFAGIETSFYLLPNGQIFRRQGIAKPFEELVSIKKKKAGAYFEKAASLQLFKQDIDKPGNLYYFVQEITNATDSRAIWGSGDYLPPQGLLALYRELHDLAQDREVAKATKKKDSAIKDPGKADGPDKGKW